jgi:amino acid adenylation domain-containing protein
VKDGIRDRVAALTPEQRALLAKRLQQRLENARSQILPVERTAKVFPLSFAQERLWFIHQLEGIGALYSIPVAVRVRGRLDVSAISRSLDELVKRHEALRTTFTTQDGQPVQVIGEPKNLPIRTIDLRAVPQPARDAEAHEKLLEIFREPFDLAAGPLLRAAVLHLEDAEHILVCVVSHLVSDGLSTVLLLRELWTYYEAFVEGKPAHLPELPVQYVDFAAWQREWLQGEVLSQQLGYWQEQLRAPLPILDLPTDHPRPALQAFDGAHHPLLVTRELADALGAVGQREGVTLFQIVLAAFQVLLHRYSGQDDIIIGSPIANRSRPELQNTIGFLVNNLTLRTSLAGDPPFRELLHRVREVAMGAYAHQDIPFERVVDALHVQRDTSRTPLFQVTFALQENVLSFTRSAGLGLELLKVNAGLSKFDLTLELFKRSEGLNGWIEYRTDLFEASTIARLSDHLLTLLASAAEDPSRRISALAMLSPAERMQLLTEWNQTAVERRDTTGHELIEAQARRTPDLVAVEGTTGRLTYKELDERANQLAHHLRHAGVGPEVRVGILMERSLDMIVGVLGTLKAGGGFLPLDPDAPSERLRFIVQDARAALVLTQQSLASRLPAETCQVLCLDSEGSAIAAEPTSPPAHNTGPRNLAYVIYTSGSTGQPKGVMLEHRGLCNLAAFQASAFQTQPGDRILQFANQGFDASVWESFMALAAGATLCLCDTASLRAGQLHTIQKERGINAVTLPPSVLAATPHDDLPALRTVVAAGESCPPQVVSRWGAGRRFFNAYGPTESTVCASMVLCDPSDEEPPSIGRPIENTELYILDRHANPVPIGVPGELCIGGRCLARGYQQRPDLTAEKFIPHPFSSEPGARLYKTGDLARYRADGNIEFLGRIDHQIKIRGFRVEPGEVEACLRQHPLLKEAVVIAHAPSTGPGPGPADIRLVAYIVAREGTPPSFGELRRFMRERLPDYMVPTTYISIDKLPLNASGKVDRRALPAPEGQRIQRDVAHVKPKEGLESTIAGIWEDVLQVKKVGAQDNFFDLGGHSLLLLKVKQRLEAALGQEISVITLFRHSTVQQLAQHLDDAKRPDALQSGRSRAEKQMMAQRQRQPPRRKP